MSDDYLMVHKSILPACLFQVIRAKQLLESGEAKSVSQAVEKAKISRSTFYKYKDCVMEISKSLSGRNAVFSMILTHETGILSSVLECISKAGASILTITQSLPIKNKASVTVSIDISSMHESITDLMRKISCKDGVENPKLIAIE